MSFYANSTYAMTKKRKNRTVSLWVIKLQGEKQEAGSRRRKARKGERKRETEENANGKLEVSG